MEVKILEKSEREVQFLVSDIDNTLANAIRRAAMGEVPVMAIEVVDITDNNSGLADEVLAHRLGMIPLKFPLDTFNVKGECTCKGRGCSNCQVELTLNKPGPGIVKASDFVSENKDVVPLYPDTPIVELLDVQAVNITALAELGYGKNHAKWQAAVAGYRNAPKVKLNPEKGDTLPAFKACPKKVFDKEGNIPLYELIIEYRDVAVRDKVAQKLFGEPNDGEEWEIILSTNLTTCSKDIAASKTS